MKEKQPDSSKIQSIQVGRPSVAKTTISLPKPELEKLKKYAKETGISFSEAIEQAIKVDELIREHMNKGGAVYFESPDGDELIKIEISRG
ncbi:ribbon-helix-helix domain-containing protein [Nostoc sp. 'Lobaria pulmonaria (5183) cyanobiont']|uniref:ribbon-helix-helix domain-containing protein n=1 Tax=Nostoc sp. 'Lobaria pulmonaria (5183) cyanobiont' TaxID=1618022 RepID=UPI000CF36212|nr:ribbon-helix-helix domain-containing protein [Nostoc sp. 'Lobaria pulmonaria (5183) cyanobiont']AVH74445.1 CopG family ribbon-helix-helix protein [Nostoc sp. 'Lobaria pulmonaria (5183) cyanobiont']